MICKNSDCRRTSLEVCMDENGTVILRVKSRHDGQTHVSEFDFEEIRREVEKATN